jgi:hypothetical protein
VSGTGGQKAEPVSGVGEPTPIGVANSEFLQHVASTLIRNALARAGKAFPCQATLFRYCGQFDFADELHGMSKSLEAIQPGHHVCSYFGFDSGSFRKSFSLQTDKDRAELTH